MQLQQLLQQSCAAVDMFFVDKCNCQCWASSEHKAWAVARLKNNKDKTKLIFVHALIWS